MVFQAVLANFGDGFEEHLIFQDKEFMIHHRLAVIKLVKDPKGKQKLIGFFRTSDDLNQACQAKFKIHELIVKWKIDKVRKKLSDPSYLSACTSSSKKNQDPKKSSSTRSASNKKNNKCTKNDQKYFFIEKQANYTHSSEQAPTSIENLFKDQQQELINLDNPDDDLSKPATPPLAFITKKNICDIMLYDIPSNWNAERITEEINSNLRFLIKASRLAQQAVIKNLPSTCLELDIFNNQEFKEIFNWEAIKLMKTLDLNDSSDINDLSDS
ncbi:hypothetical protein C1645_838073 [Glomus cerebriforme]|uniref:Uncharacterized protein n=1 Tax=Glomus cerebriforme TaxID=658196 RepID=A0A397S7M4_9GLOM|nr:hypothetical protein C1645_838073 [Glomus cerebriforme]